MLSFLDSQYFKWKYRISQFLDDLKNDEYGISGIVAAIILLLIAVVLAMSFWDKISNMVTTWFKEITDANKTTDIKKIGP